MPFIWVRSCRWSFNAIARTTWATSNCRSSAATILLLAICPTRASAPRVRVGNTLYNLFSFHTSATAIKTGTFALGPATWSLAVLSGQRNFFGMAESHQASFTSDAPEIRVLPVPTNGAPPSFSGALGDFTLAQYDAGPPPWESAIPLP